MEGSLSWAEILDHATFLLSTKKCIRKSARRDSPSAQKSADSPTYLDMSTELEIEPGLAELRLEHDPGTPDVTQAVTPDGSDASAAGADSTTNVSAYDDGFIFGAATRLGGRILTDGRDPWTHNAWYAGQFDRLYKFPGLSYATVHAGTMSHGMRSRKLPLRLRSRNSSPCR